jgi:two-component system phosphate regulon response regulator PhoB
MQRILIVEDNLMAWEMLKTILTQKGYEALVEQDLQSARRRIDAENFDLVLLDLNLPDGNGLDLLEYMRKDLGLQTPVIILSALKQESTVLRGLELGANDYITKPFSVKEALLRIEKAL